MERIPPNPDQYKKEVQNPNSDYINYKNQSPKKEVEPKNNDSDDEQKSASYEKDSFIVSDNAEDDESE